MKDINRLLSGSLADMSALEALYRLFKQDVFAFSFSIVKNYSLAEECVQETFVRLPRASAAAGEIKNGKAFILGVARNVALEIIHKNKKYILTDTVKTATEGNAAPSMEDEFEVMQMLEGLDEEQRQIVVMHIFNDLTFKEIARLLSMNVSTVK